MTHPHPHGSVMQCASVHFLLFMLSQSLHFCDHVRSACGKLCPAILRLTFFFFWSDFYLTSVLVINQAPENDCSSHFILVDAEVNSCAGTFLISALV